MRLLDRIYQVKGINWQGDTRELYRRALNIAIPAAIEGALLSVISAVDTKMVSSRGLAAVAATSLTAQPRMILLIITQALSVGTTALIARRRGENDRAGANSVLSQSMLLMTVVGFVISVIGFFCAEPIMKIAGANEDTLALSVSYMRIISLGLILNGWSLCLCAGLRAIGQTRVTLVTNLTANIVNVILNYCLINGHFGFPAWGVKGAAVATVIGTFVSTVVAFLYVSRSQGYLFFRLTAPKFDKTTLSGLLRVGSSSAAESAFLRIGFFINSRLIADLGTNEFAAYSIVQLVTSLSFTLGDGVGTAGATLVGQSLGANRKDMAMAYVKVARKISVTASLCLMILIFCLRRVLAGLFTDVDVVIAGASAAFIAVVFGIMPQNGRVVFSGCLRGAGDVMYVAVCALISVMVVRPILTYVLCYPLNGLLPSLFLAYSGPWIAFLIDAVLRETLLRYRVKTGRFLNIKL